MLRIAIATTILVFGSAISTQAATVTRKTVVDRSMLEIVASVLEKENRGGLMKSTGSTNVKEILDKGKLINRKGVIGIEFDNKRTFTKCFRVLFWTKCATFYCDEKVQITVPIEAVKDLDWDNNWKSILSDYFVDDLAGLKIGYWLKAHPNWMMCQASVISIIQGEGGKTSITTWVTLNSNKRRVRKKICGACHTLTNQLHASFLQMINKVPDRKISSLAIINLLNKVADGDHSKNTGTDSKDKKKLPIGG